MATFRSALAGQRRAVATLTPEKMVDVLREEVAPPKILPNVFAKSRIPTMYFQDSLPRLPIPKLEDTCRDYLLSVKPLMEETDFAATEKAVRDFEQGVGLKLQDTLKATDKKNKHTSYISADWYDMYLSARTPLPVNWNPFLVFRDDPTPEKNKQVQRVASFLKASLFFQEALRNQTLAPEVFHLNPKRSKTAWFENLCVFPLWRSYASYVSIAGKAFPLDMSQFNSLFGCSRIPGLGKDHLHLRPASVPDYVAVFFRGHVFKVPLTGKGGGQASVDEIAARLQHILTAHSSLKQAQYPIGALTAMDRDSWAKARKEMCAVPPLKAALETIDNAMFVVCLDDETADFSSPEKVTEMGRLFLHGDAKKSNRWWDKSFSIIATSNGKVSCNFEHSWGDGVAVMRWCNDIFHSAANISVAQDPKDMGGQEPTMLEIEQHLPESVKQQIRTSCEGLHKIVHNMKYDVSVYPGLGKKGLKQLNVSADAFFQQGFQLAYQRLHGRARSTYESASTAAFKHGRTEAIRACTIESKDFVKAMMGDGTSKEKRRELLKAAMHRHTEITKKALMGKGVDRHLFALRKIAEREGNVPALFTDAGYGTLNENVISTSTLYSDTLMLGGFGPVHDEGYGIGYSATPNLLFLGVTSHQNDCKNFVNGVWQAVEEMEALLA